VSLGDRCDLGVGAVVRPYVKLGIDVVVGAGAAVVRDHEGPATLLGVPARPR
jgi:acetyltransferase-like isoleucine patch superfamily enzyme